MRTTKARLAALLLAFMVGVGSVSVVVARADEKPAPPVSEIEELERQKLAAETQKATVERKKLEGDEGTFWRLAPDLAPILTALIAGAGLFITIRKAGADRFDAVEKEADNREAAATAAEIVRFDERFANAVAGLSSAKPDEQRGAAVLIASMVREKREDLSDQALQLLLVALQSEHDPACEKILTFALARFARAAPSRLLATENKVPIFGLARIKAAEIDLSRLALPGLDLAFATLHGADFRESDLEKSGAYQADLSDARLNEANLAGAGWVEVSAPRAKFQNANLGRARFYRADLTRANLYKADLRRANLRHSKLQGARLDGADISGADFFGASVDETTLRSLLKARNWEQATFDPRTRGKLEEIG